MTQRWTTISESEETPVQDVTPPVSGNRKKAILFAVLGIGLLLVGATPFIFSGSQNGENYSAFLTGNSKDFSADISKPELEEEPEEIDIPLEVEPIEVSLEEMGITIPDEEDMQGISLEEDLFLSEKDINIPLSNTHAVADTITDTFRQNKHTEQEQTSVQATSHKMIATTQPQSGPESIPLFFTSILGAYFWRKMRKG